MVNVGFIQRCIDQSRESFHHCFFVAHICKGIFCLHFFAQNFPNIVYCNYKYQVFANWSQYHWNSTINKCVIKEKRQEGRLFSLNIQNEIPIIILNTCSLNNKLVYANLMTVIKSCEFDSALYWFINMYEFILIPH